jgi:signal transduction histidine kinase
MAIVAVLAGLQYRWLGQVSRAERQRMQETITARAVALADDIDHEISRAFVMFQLRAAEADAPGPALARRYQMWREVSRYPDLVREVYLAPGDGTLQKLAVPAGTLAPVAWPHAFTPLREATGMPAVAVNTVTAAPHAGGGGQRGTFTFRFPQTVSADPLALSVLLPFTHPHASFAVVLLDERVFTGQMLPALVKQHLGDSLDDYYLSIVKTSTPSETVYQPAGDKRITTGDADVTVAALNVRQNFAERLRTTELRAAAEFAAGLAAARPAPPSSSAPAAGVLFVTPEIVTGVPATGTMHRVTTMARAVTTPGGAWQVLLKHRAGSLEAAVQQVRRRNLLMSFGMLALLAASVGLVLVSAQRAERLASQQMDFVATVSHELRTPLAVIRSAGQNLADGVVQDPKRYGELIETEGRRLTDMIEQTLALAGLSGGRRPLAQQPVDAGDLVRGVIASPETAAQAGAIAIDARVAEDLPLVAADEMLLRRGVQNLVGNALKYGGAGGWVGVSVDAHTGRQGREVRITISDHGPGVPAEDLPHIFEPFYRGTRAVSDQVQGNGLGLHLVRRIAEAHGGRVSVKSAPGEGAAFTIHLPVSRLGVLHPVGGEQPQHS